MLPIDKVDASGSASNYGSTPTAGAEQRIARQSTQTSDDEGSLKSLKPRTRDSSAPAPLRRSSFRSDTSDDEAPVSARYLRIIGGLQDLSMEAMGKMRGEINSLQNDLSGFSVELNNAVTALINERAGRANDIEIGLNIMATMDGEIGRLKTEQAMEREIALNTMTEMDGEIGRLGGMVDNLAIDLHTTLSDLDAERSQKTMGAKEDDEIRKRRIARAKAFEAERQRLISENNGYKIENDALSKLINSTQSKVEEMMSRLGYWQNLLQESEKRTEKHINSAKEAREREKAARKEKEELAHKMVHVEKTALDAIDQERVKAGLAMIQRDLANAKNRLFGSGVLSPGGTGRSNSRDQNVMDAVMNNFQGKLIDDSAGVGTARGRAGREAIRATKALNRRAKPLMTPEMRVASLETQLVALEAANAQLSKDYEKEKASTESAKQLSRTLVGQIKTLKLALDRASAKTGLSLEELLSEAPAAMG